MTTTDQENAVTAGSPAIRLESSDITVGRLQEQYGLSLTGDRSSAFGAAAATSVSAGQPGKTRYHKRPPGALPDLEARSTLRIRWKEAREAAQAMVQAAEIKDQMGLGIAADELDKALDALWGLRVCRDVNWKAILNQVQGMMRQYFSQKRIEQLTSAQCDKILTIVTNCLGTGTKSVDDLNEAVRLIEDAGFDPYAAISGDPVKIDD